MRFHDRTLESATSGRTCKPEDSEDVFTRCCADPPDCAARGPDADRPCSVKSCASLDWLEGTEAVYGIVDKDARFQPVAVPRNT